MERYSEEVSRLLDYNAVAKGIVDAMTEEQRALFLRRLEQKGSWAEKKEYIDSLVGWQEGHPPYQL